MLFSVCTFWNIFFKFSPTQVLPFGRFYFKLLISNMYILEDFQFNLTYFKFGTKHYTFSSSGKLKITVPVNTKSLSMLIFYEVVDFFDFLEFKVLHIYPNLL